MTEVYCGGVVAVVIVFNLCRPRKILVLLRVEAMALVSCSYVKFFLRPMGATY